MTEPLTLPAGISFFQRGWLSSNNVLLQDEMQAVLIDSGYWTHAQQTASLLSQHLGARPLTRLINTHLHSDHCGGNAKLQEIYPHVTTLIPPGHANYVFDWDPAALTYTPTGQHCPKFVAHDVIRDQDCFLVGQHTWVAHSAPGHDPNSIFLFCEDLGILISADALWENGFGVVFPEIEGIDAFEEVGQTLHLIESLQPKVILPGHGSAFTDIRAALHNARSRLDSFRKDPVKHANYAAKVLLKFKLLELQEIDIEDFIFWAEQCNYLKLLQIRYAAEMSFRNWTISICDNLIKSGAALRESNQLINL